VKQALGSLINQKGSKRIEKEAIMKFYEILSKIADYPRDNYRDFLETAIIESRNCSKETTLYLEEFKSYVEDYKIHELEEIYTRTFDIKGQCCLDLGYVLFGEDYKRGDFLVNIQKMQKDNGVDTGVELPDHLTNILKLLNALGESKDLVVQKKLIEKIVMPAITKMLQNFPKKCSKNNYYGNVLKAVDSAFKADFVMDGTILEGATC